jgi:hypothetical protein
MRITINPRFRGIQKISSNGSIFQPLNGLEADRRREATGEAGQRIFELSASALAEKYSDGGGGSKMDGGWILPPEFDFTYK